MLLATLEAVGNLRPAIGKAVHSARPGNQISTRGIMALQLELVLACGVLALLYGGLTVRSVLAQSPGNPRMQEIAAAI